MAIVSIVLTLLFAVILCIIELPKMISEKLHKEIWTFSILLSFGVIIAIFKCFEVHIPNPSDWISWVYSPISNLLKNVL